MRRLMSFVGRRWITWLLVAAVVLVVAVVAGRGLIRRGAPAVAAPVEPVERRDITVTVEATGTVEPIDLVEIKSKASGQILRMPVEVGSVVRRGDLLAQIDTVDVQNQYDQVFAAREAAQARVDVSTAKKRRAEQLFAEGIITAEEHENATLEFANAQSALVKARTDLDIARQRLEDATVRAPIAGTVLEQPVAVGQVISSATSNVGGGTTLLKMADLNRIRVRVLVSETDIGSVRPGQPATVQVDAYPQRAFQGQVEKIEPQAVVEQSVTMFPVLVSLPNEEGLLLPGMNGEVTMLVARQSDVLAVPVDALRSVREAGTVATALGLDPDSVRARIGAQVRARFAAGADSARAGRRAGARRPGAGDTLSGNRGGASARGGAASGARGGTIRPGAAGGAFPGGFSGAGPTGASGSTGGRAGAGQVVFVMTARGLEPRLVRIGIRNFDYAQVVDGLSEGEEVALISVAELQARRNQSIERIRERVGSTMPGAGGSSGGSGGTRRGGP